MTRKGRSWRLILVLAAFFNFSSLNNGFAFFVISSGHVQRIDFTPCLLKGAVNLVNPLNWKENFSPILKSSFFRSRDVVVFTSRNAIANLLAESTLIQIWMRTALTNNFKRNSEYPQLSQKESKAYKSQVQTILSVGKELYALAEGSLVKTESLSEWLLERHRLLSRRRDIGENPQGLPGPQGSTSVFDVFFISWNRAIPLLGFMPENLKLWLCSSLSRGGGAPIGSIPSLCNFKITLFHILQGDFLFMGGRGIL